MIYTKLNSRPVEIRYDWIPLHPGTRSEPAEGGYAENIEIIYRRPQDGKKFVIKYHHLNERRKQEIQNKIENWETDGE